MFFLTKSREADKEPVFNDKLIECAIQYAQELQLPDPKINIWIRRKHNYLLFFADEGELRYLNVGYAAAQTASFLKFQGIPSALLREFPTHFQECIETDKGCVALLELGCQPVQAIQRKRRKGKVERPCICSELGEDWIEQVLTFARKQFSGKSSISTVRRDDEIDILLHRMIGKKETDSSLEAGVAIAAIMAAAEALWIDLELEQKNTKRSQEKKTQRYLVSIGRKRTMATV